MNTTLEAAIKSKAVELGFDLVGITTAEPSAFAAEYRDWIGNGYAGEMEYLARNLERRADPRLLLPDARSIIVVGMNYYTREEGRGNREEGEVNPHPQPLSRKRREGSMVTDSASERRREEEKGRGDDFKPPLPPGEGGGEGDGATPSEDDQLRPTTGFPARREADRAEGDLRSDLAVFARYARGDDYHDVMTARLRTLLECLKAEAGPDANGRVYVDTGPILEREAARRAGLGWFGKNTMLINTRRGSYFFLGEIVTNVMLTPDDPAVGSCGTCTRCLDACPTDAFVAPFILDSRRCISYLTIELKGAIPEEFIPAIGAAGNRVYGCDICQEVCPFNTDRESGRQGDKETYGENAIPIHGASPTTEPAFQPRPITTNTKLTNLLYLTQEHFSEKFKGSAVKRAKRRGLLRNAIAALAGRDDAEVIAALEHALNDPDELVRAAAMWALAHNNERKL